MIKSVNKSLEILEILGDSNLPCGVSEIATKIGADKSSIYRILKTLENKGFVEQVDNNRKYILGLKILSLGALLLKKLNLVPILRPFLDKLAKITGETVHLAVLRGSKVIYIDRIESSEVVTVSSSIGKTEPSYCSATGKAILAFFSLNNLKNTLNELKAEGFTKFTEKTILSTAELEKELEKTRNNGYGFDDEERFYGVRCIAAPIIDHKNEVVASIGISGPISRMIDQKVPLIAANVMDIAKESSDFLKNLGWDIK